MKENTANVPQVRTGADERMTCPRMPASQGMNGETETKGTTGRACVSYRSRGEMPRRVVQPLLAPDQHMAPLTRSPLLAVQVNEDIPVERLAGQSRREHLLKTGGQPNARIRLPRERRVLFTASCRTRDADCSQDSAALRSSGA
ncbi:hypothetical protein, partial [Myxococcus vastator]|uniref:hypothetical protein n=1 Tax=Myxococcus vastator TaxID=2709664 RepID=UPI0019684E14